MFTKRNIYIADLNSTGPTHILINVSMIKVLLKAYPGSNITFYSEEKHQQIAADFFSTEEKSRVFFNPLIAKKKNNSLFSKLISSFTNSVEDLLLLRKLLSLSKDNGVVILFKSHALTLLLFKYLKNLHPNVPAMAILHGEIEFVDSGENKWERNIGNLLKRVLKQNSANFIYIILNKISKNLLINRNLISRKDAIEIMHPYPFTFRSQRNNVEDKKQIIVAHVGSLGVRKNAHLLYSLAKMCEDIDRKLIRFWAVGAIEPDVKEFRNELVLDFANKDGAGKYISREIFEKRIEEIDYAVFFYAKNQFVYRASGAILDVIEAEKPIIVIRHPFFDYLFGAAGNIGFQCDNLEQMSAYIRRIAKRDRTLIDQYEEQCTNLRKFKMSNDIESIARDFTDQLRMIGHASYN